MKRIIITILAVMLLTLGCSSNAEEKIKVHESPSVEVTSISFEEVKEIIDNYSDYENVTIIDVRSSSEYHNGHIEKAINLPLDIIENIDVSRKNKIIVYCQSGRRSNQAAIKLIGLGYEKVYDMGGIENWPYDIDK